MLSFQDHFCITCFSYFCHVLVELEGDFVSEEEEESTTWSSQWASFCLREQSMLFLCHLLQEATMPLQLQVQNYIGAKFLWTFSFDTVYQK